MATLESVFLAVVLLSSLLTTSAAPNQGADAVLKIPSECVDQRYCSVKPEGYDLIEEKINKLLPGLPLVDDFTQRNGQENPVKPPTLSPKEDWHNCPYETKTESLYMYTHANSTKMDIIVQTKLLRQYVTIVTCASRYIEADSSEQCFRDLGLIGFGMKSSCVNSLATSSLYVYDVDRNKIIQKPFKVPACCSCRVSYT